MAVAVDLLIVGLILGMTWALMSEGLWGAALMFFNVLFATLVAFNFYEPLARLIVENAGAWATGFADTFCLTVLFLVTLVLLRITTETLGPAMVRFPAPVYHIGRIAFGLAAAVLTTAFLLVAFETAPVQKRVFGVIGYNTKPPFGYGLDRGLLAFVQYTSGYPFARYGNDQIDPHEEFGDAHVFDPRGRWLIDHEEARPYGTGQLDEFRDALAGSSQTPAAAGAQAGPAPGAAVPQ
jgi:hypothetical protein